MHNAEKPERWLNPKDLFLLCALTADTSPPFSPPTMELLEF